jgi:O-antigen/teichoic acid export membrane protein
MNASYYIASMSAAFVSVAPSALTTTLYAVGASAPSALGRRIRFTLGLTLLCGLLANAVLLFAADFVLRLFGEGYAEAAGWTLRILVLGVFPLAIKDHYVAICRIRGRVGRGATLIGLGACAEILFAALGAIMGGLVGLSLGWLAAVSLEALVMTRPVLRAAADEHGHAHPQATELAVSTPGAGESGRRRTAWRCGR